MKRNLSSVFILFSFLAAHAEHDYYLSSALNSNNNYHYTANSHIQLVKGFSANPQNGHEVLLDIDGYDLEPIVGMTHGGTIYNNNYGVVGAIGASIDISKLGGAIYNIPSSLTTAKEETDCWAGDGIFPASPPSPGQEARCITTATSTA